MPPTRFYPPTSKALDAALKTLARPSTANFKPLQPTEIEAALAPLNKHRAEQLEAKAKEILRLVVLLRMTIDRRFPPDSVIEHALMQVEREANALIDDTTKEK